MSPKTKILVSNKKIVDCALKEVYIVCKRIICPLISRHCQLKNKEHNFYYIVDSILC